MKLITILKSPALALAILVSSCGVQGALSNGGFDVPGAGLTAPNYSVSGTGPASAADWTLWNNDPNKPVTSELLPSTDPLGSGYMIHVTGGQDSGLVQPASGPSSASVDILDQLGVEWVILAGKTG